MKHIFLSIFSSLLIVSAMAQTTDVNFALASLGATATATSGNAAAAIDGNQGTRWESTFEDPQVWTLDLGQEREFNTFKIIWEAAYAKAFTISTSLDSLNWTPVFSLTDQALESFPNAQLYTITPTKARYIQFLGEERATVYGYSFWEFEVFMAGESVLTSLELTTETHILQVGDTTPLQLLARDQHGKLISLPEDVIYTVTPATAGVVTDHIFTALQTGPASVIAIVGEVQSEAIELVAYDGENLALSTPDNNKIIASSPSFLGYEAYQAVDGLDYTLWQGCPDNGTEPTDSARTYDAWFIVDLGALCNVNLLSIYFEGACAQDYHVDYSMDNITWNTLYTHVGEPGIHQHTQPICGEPLQSAGELRYLRFWSTKAATQWGVKIIEFSVYGFPVLPSSLPEVSVDSQVSKQFVNGQLIIIRDGVKYNAQGVRL